MTDDDDDDDDDEDNDETQVPPHFLLTGMFYRMTASELNAGSKIRPNFSSNRNHPGFRVNVVSQATVKIRKQRLCD